MKNSKKIVAVFLAALFFVSSQLSAWPAWEFLAAGNDTGAFVVTGGTYGVDYEYVTGQTVFSAQAYGQNEFYNTTQYTPKSGGVVNCTQDVLKIKTSTPLTISTNGTSTAGIVIYKRGHAALTVYKVNI